MERKTVLGITLMLFMLNTLLGFIPSLPVMGAWFKVFNYNDALFPPDLSLVLSEEHSPPGWNETSEYLIGSVAVGVVFLESNGTIDPSTEDWDSIEVSNVISEITTGLNWLVSQNPNAGVSFTLTINGVPTSYEPITRNSSTGTTDQRLWISEAMTYLGYPGTDYNAQVQWFNNVLRNSSGTDWAFTMFIVDSSNDSDGSFADGLSAYAYFGGPFFVMTYDNGGYGISNMDFVSAHETCHIFYATDEYNGVTEYSGYLNVVDNDGSGDMMDLANTWWLCTNSREQLGWRDSDGDGLQDIVDTFPNTVLNPYSPDPTTNLTLTYTGTVEEIPYPNSNPRGTGRNVTINTIALVIFRVDNGDWQNATSDDGAFDEAAESFSFTTSPLSIGTHTIEALGINSVGNVEITYASDIVTIEEKHDVAVTSVVPFKTVVGQGYSLNINVTVTNQGDYTETFNVTAYANTTIIATLTNIPLTSGNSTTITFTWNTTGVPYGNYTIIANATILQGETYTDDNKKTDGWVVVSFPADFNGDDHVGYIDYGWLAAAYASRPEYSNWNPNCDVDGDNKIGYIEYGLLAHYYGSHWP